MKKRILLAVCSTLISTAITSEAAVTTTAANSKSWTFRKLFLGIPGERTLAATVGSVSAASRITIRAWNGAKNTAAAHPLEIAADRVRLGRATQSVDSSGGMQNLHLGGLAAAFHRKGGDAIESSQARAKNVILFIGDGIQGLHHGQGQRDHGHGSPSV